jgi:hypothetical protein
MRLLVFLFICGVILAISRAVSPTWNAKFEKAVVDLIRSVGVVMMWAMWILVAYVVLAWVGIVEWPEWMKEF